MFTKQAIHGLTAFLVVLLLIVCSAVDGQAQFDQYGRWENGVTEPWFVADFKKEEIETVQSLWKAIESENQGQSTHEWAGDYFIGSDTHGTYMRWSPQAGFVIAHVNKCEARLMGMTYGKVADSPTLVQFFPTFNKTASTTHGHSQSHAKTLAEMRFIPVKWRGYHLLVADDEMRDFGDYVGGLGKYNVPHRAIFDGLEFFTKLQNAVSSQTQAAEPNRESRVDKSPVIVPPGYEHYLKRPIDAQIIEISPGHRKKSENLWWDDFVIPVKINVGSAHGVRREMVLKVLESNGFGGLDEEVEIKQVSLRTSQGVVVRTIRKKPCVLIDETDDCKNPEYQALKVGQRVTTNPFD